MKGLSRYWASKFGEREREGRRVRGMYKLAGGERAFFPYRRTKGGDGDRDMRQARKKYTDMVVLMSEYWEGRFYFLSLLGH